jgi:hypothetical protein
MEGLVNMKSRFVLSVAVLSLASAQSFSVQVDIKPGLWEHTMKFDEGSIKAMQKEQQLNMDKQLETMKKRMAELPPEQRAQVEEVIKQQGGDVNQLGSAFLGQALQEIAKPQISKECLTQEQIDKGLFSTSEKDCRSEITKTGGNTFKMVADCKGSHSEIDITVQNPKLYTGAAVFTSDEAGSKRVVKASLAHKWLSSDCGSIRPAAEEELEEELE